MRRTTLVAAAGIALAMCAAGCRQEVPESNAPHPRMVTFSPALTRIVFDMGFGDHVVGVTTYCRPPKGEKRTIVGDNLNVRVEPILAVKPDMMLVQMELKYFEPLRRVNPDVHIEHFTIEKLEDIGAAMERIGTLVGEPETGRAKKQEFLDRLETLRKRTEKLERVPTLFVLGYQNPSGPGRETFIDEMITLAGGRNVLAEQYKGWATPSLETVVRTSPAVIICQTNVSEEPEAAAYWKALRLGSKNAQRVITVTDDDWTLPADHLADYVGQMAEFIHPELKEGSR